MVPPSDIDSILVTPDSHSSLQSQLKIHNNLLYLLF